MKVVADFHNHTCLSPCGSLELSPKVLVERAVKRGVGILALTDHNSALNTPAFEQLCRDAKILPLCGIEVTTLEELHCLCLFADSEAALTFGTIVEANLLKVSNKPEKWGDQVWVNANEMILGTVAHYLGTSTGLSLTTLGNLCHRSNGLFIPAHIDRPSQSILSQLGFLPDEPYDALEVRQGTGGLDVRDLTLVRGSDAHYPDDVGTRTCFVEIDRLDFAALRTALRNRQVNW